MKPPKPPLLPIPSNLHEHTPTGVFWRPNAAFIAELTQDLQGKRVLEIFAGNGLLAGLLNANGIQVTATSLLSGMDAHYQGLYHPVVELDGLKAVERFAADHDVLLMCWPTTTRVATAATIAWHLTKQAAKLLAPIVYVGEFTDYSRGHLGGCADDLYFELFQSVHEFESYRGNMLERACRGRLQLPGDWVANGSPAWLRDVVLRSTKSHLLAEWRRTEGA